LDAWGAAVVVRAHRLDAADAEEGVVPAQAVRDKGKATMEEAIASYNSYYEVNQ